MAEGTAQLLTPQQVIAITDKAALVYNTLDPLLGDGSAGTTASYYASRLLGYVVGLDGTYYGLGDHYKIANVSPGAQTFFDSLCSETFWRNAVSALMNGLNSNFARYGPYVSADITNIDSYATYYNTTTPFSMLYSSSFARLYWYWRGKSAMLSGTNVLATPTVLATGSVAGVASVGFTDGDALPEVSTPAAGLQGYACDNIHLQIVSGTFTGTLVATGVNQLGATTTWQCVGSAVSSGTLAFVPATAGDRTRDILGLAYSGNGTSCQFLIVTNSRVLV